MDRMLPSADARKIGQLAEIAEHLKNVSAESRETADAMADIAAAQKDATEQQEAVIVLQRKTFIAQVIVLWLTIAMLVLAGVSVYITAQAQKIPPGTATEHPRRQETSPEQP